MKEPRYQLNLSLTVNGALALDSALNVDPPPEYVPAYVRREVHRMAEQSFKEKQEWQSRNRKFMLRRKRQN